MWLPRDLRTQNRLLALIAILVVCTFTASFFDIVWNFPFVFALLFIIPIVLSAEWFYKKAVYVAIFLGLVSIVSALFPFPSQMVPLDEILRMALFVIIAYVLGDMNEKRDKDLKQLKKLNTAILQLSDPVFITDAKGVIEFVNPAFEKLTGYLAKEAIGQTPRILKSGRYKSEFYKDLWGKILSGKDFTGEVVNKKKDGSVYLVERTITPIVGDFGKVSHFIATGKDITDRKILEQRINDYMLDLEKQVKDRTQEVLQTEKMAALGVLVAGVAHEVNNPLSFVKANTQIVLEDLNKLKGRSNKADEKLIEDSLELLRINKEGIERIAAITKALKRFARPDSGERVATDINQGIKDSLILLGNQMKHKVKIHEEYGDIPPIICNIGQLNQVVVNMLNNSMEAMETGDVWIRTWSADGDVFVSIKDNGSGIDPKIQGRIFDPFYTTKEMGTGLGLTISYRIIKDHGGDILLESEVGKGTTMTIRIPIAPKKK
jgi:PAS domain S-box-containing protein